MIESIIRSILEGLWSNFYVQYGVAGVILLGCAALFYLVPFNKAREVAILVAILDLIFIIGAPKLYLEGVHHERAIWEAKVKAAEDNAEQARRDAEAEVPPLAPDVASAGSGVAAPPTHPQPAAKPSLLHRLVPHPRRVPDGRDRYDRNNKQGAVRGLQADQLLRAARRVLQGHGHA